MEGGGNQRSQFSTKQANPSTNQTSNFLCRLFEVKSNKGTMKYTIATFLSALCLGNALDLTFDSLTCDTSLPAYADDNGITMTCNGSNKCSLGDNSLIMGSCKFISHIFMSKRIDNSHVVGFVRFFSGLQRFGELGCWEQHRLRLGQTTAHDNGVRTLRIFALQLLWRLDC